MQLLNVLSWFYAPTAIAAPQVPDDPPATIGTWTLDDMHRAMATGDVTVLHRKSFPKLANQLLNQPKELCAQRNTLPAIEGGLLAFLGTLMQIHPTNPSVHYLALRLLFSMLHATSPQQLATLASPIMNALRTFRSTETHLTAPEGTLINRTLIGNPQQLNPHPPGVPRSPTNGAPTANTPAQGDLSPHVIQEIHLMATAILCKISFAIPLPPYLAQHCADQLLAVAEGNENPRLRRIEEEAARQQLRVRAAAAAAKGSNGNNANADEPVPNALLAEIETYFSNRNREMRKVLAKMVGDAIHALHEASDRFAPTTDLAGADDDGGYETDETMSALFRPDMSEVTKRNLFDTHGMLWMAVLEAVGEDIAPSLKDKAQAVIVAVGSNTTDSQLRRMARQRDDHATLGGGGGVGGESLLMSTFGGTTANSTLSADTTAALMSNVRAMSTFRAYSRDTFFFGLKAMIHVAQYLRLGYKGGWLTCTNDHLLTIYNIFLQYHKGGDGSSCHENGHHSTSDPPGNDATAAAGGFGGLNSSSRNGGGASANNNSSKPPNAALTSGQKLVDELLVAILGSFEYAMILFPAHGVNPDNRRGMVIVGGGFKNDGSTMQSATELNPTPIARAVSAILASRQAQLRHVQRIQVEGAADGTNGGVPNALAVHFGTTVLPFLQRSCQMAIVVGRIYASLSQATQRLIDASGGSSLASTPPSSGIMAMGAAAAAQQAANSSQSPTSYNPRAFLRALTLIQCDGLLDYSLTLQEVLESMWLTTHMNSRSPTADTDAITQALAGHYVYMSQVLCPRVAEVLGRHLSPIGSMMTMASPNGDGYTTSEGGSQGGDAIITLADILGPQRAAAVGGGGYVSPASPLDQTSPTTASSSAIGIANKAVAYLTPLQNIEPLVLMLMSHPFNLPCVGTLVATRNGGGAIITNTAGQRVLHIHDLVDVNEANVALLINALGVKAVQLSCFVVGAEKPQREAKEKSIGTAGRSGAGAMVASLAWGVMSMIGSGVVTATSAVASAAVAAATTTAGGSASTSTAAINQPLLANKPIAQQFYTSTVNTTKLVQEWCIIAAPQHSTAANRIGVDFTNGLVFGHLLNSKGGLFDTVALRKLQVAVGANGMVGVTVPECRRFIPAAVTMAHLRTLAKLWRRHTGIVCNDRLVGQVEALLEGDLPRLTSRFDVAMVALFTKQERKAFRALVKRLSRRKGMPYQPILKMIFAFMPQMYAPIGTAKELLQRVNANM